MPCTIGVTVYCGIRNSARYAKIINADAGAPGPHIIQMSCLLEAKILPKTTPGHRPLTACIPVIRHRRSYIIMSTLSVQEYIDKHELSKKVEDAINQTVKIKPEEPLSYMVSIPVLFWR